MKMVMTQGQERKTHTLPLEAGIEGHNQNAKWFCFHFKYAYPDLHYTKYIMSEAMSNVLFLFIVYVITIVYSYLGSKW